MMIFMCLIENIWRDAVFALDLEENTVAWMHVKLDGAFNFPVSVPRTATALLATVDAAALRCDSRNGTNALVPK